jgi:hypothetical protein
MNTRFQIPSSSAAHRSQAAVRLTADNFLAPGAAEPANFGFQPWPALGSEFAAKLVSQEIASATYPRHHACMSARV